MTSSQDGDPNCVLRVWLSEAAGRWSRAPGSLQVLPCLTPSADSSSPRTYKTHYDGAASRGYRHQQCRGEGVTSAHDEWQCSPILSTTKKSSGRMRQVRTVRTPETCNQCMKMNTQPGPPLSFSETTGGRARAASLTPPPFGRAAPPGKQHAPDPRACRQVCAMLNPLPQYPPTRSWPCVPPHSAFPISVRHQKYASRCLTQQQGCPLVSVGVGLAAPDECKCATPCVGTRGTP